MKLPYFSIISNKNKFFDNLKTGNIFRYTDSYTENEIISMGERRGKILKPTSVKYGENTLMVTKNLLNPPPKIFHYDAKNLDI